MKEITDLQREMLKKYHLDAMVTMTPENITYVTGAYIPTQVTVRSRKVIHIITEKHDPVVIVVNIEEPIMRAQSWMDPKSIISYNEFTQNTMMIAIARGRRWQRYIGEGRFRNVTELAHAIGREPGKVA